MIKHALIAFLSVLASLSLADSKKTSIVSVVHGEVALISSQTRGYAFSRARSISRALDEAGVDNQLYSDTDLNKALAAPCKIAHLISMERPTDAQQTRLTQFLQQGGKLIIYYSESAPLAQLMDLHPPTIKRADTNPWIRFRFTDKRPLHSPEAIATRTRRISEALPATSDGRVLAQWENASGHPGAAAVVKTPKGYWISAILLDESDADDRRHFFAALSADCAAEVWRHAAKRLDNDVWKIAGGTSFETARANLLSTVRTGKRRLLDDQLASAEHLIQAKNTDFKKGLFGASMPKLWQLRHVLFRAQATAMHINLDGATVAVWDKTGMGFFPGDWTSTATLLKKASVTDVYLLAEGQEKALIEAVKGCRPYNIRVHAWFHTLSLESWSDAKRQAFLTDGRGLINASGKQVAWIDPADPRNRKEIARHAATLTTRTGVDGIHFDYMRYPLEDSASSPIDRRRFEKWLGRRAKKWPEDIKHKGALRASYNAWRAEQVTGLLNETCQAIRQAAPKTIISVAVYASGHNNSVGQNWYSWVKSGLIDYAVPMNYSPDATALSRLLADQVIAAPRSHIVCGIGVTAYEGNLNPVETIQQIETALAKKIKGIALYHMDERFKTEIIPALERAR